MVASLILLQKYTFKLLFFLIFIFIAVLSRFTLTHCNKKSTFSFYAEYFIRGKFEKYENVSCS